MGAKEATMIELTEEQQQAVEAHPEGAVQVLNPRTQKRFVLLPAEMYERLKSMRDGDTVYATAEMVDAVMAEDDAADPYLQEYQRMYGEGRP
jgi:hypothetical protein